MAKTSKQARFCLGSLVFFGAPFSPRTTSMFPPLVGFVYFTYALQAVTAYQEGAILMKRCGFMLLSIIVLFGAVSLCGAGMYTTTQITNNSYDEFYPQINDNGHVVWEEYDGSDYEIFLYDGTSTTQITNNDYNDSLVGWVEERNPTTEYGG